MNKEDKGPKWIVTNPHHKMWVKLHAPSKQTAEAIAAERYRICGVATQIAGNR